MKGALDSTIIVSALAGGDGYQEACSDLVYGGDVFVYNHAFAETFSTITGSRLGFRISPSRAAELICDVVPQVTVGIISIDEIVAALTEAESRGVRGGAIYDFLHLMVAKQRGIARVFTLNAEHFLAFHRPGNPEIVHP